MFGHLHGENFLPGSPKYRPFGRIMQLSGEIVGLVQQYDVPTAVLILPLFHAAKPGIFNGQAGLLKNLSDNRCAKGFAAFYVTSGKGNARPIGIYTILYQHSITVIDHTHIGQRYRDLPTHFPSSRSRWISSFRPSITAFSVGSISGACTSSMPASRRS